MDFELISNFYNQYKGAINLGIASVAYLAMAPAINILQKRQNNNRQNIREFDFYLNEFKRNESFDNANNLYKANQKFYWKKLNNKQLRELEQILDINKNIFPEKSFFKKVNKYF